ncbi:putative 3-phosphoglycerate dehydrogenase [Acaromyces ingoldii]|uniref:Putative 3-phosphoglycerate dehydrogenase n=1 Tax=Acaromyces ingoldii TaxID=215250 RepID=A0A316YTP0_9BASI|nr:putative 3-phosphoglycerate dehydrogenase [Acaromyces ingoldii]PWN91115.1 putative 3-phosphoglycerate dehydrogenase [Acaromyces ingoldii]
MENGHSQAFHRAPASVSPPTGFAQGQGSFSGMMAAGQTHARQGSMSLSPQSPPGSSTAAAVNGVLSARSRAVSIPGHSAAQVPKMLTPFDMGDIRILLLENVSQGAVDMLRQQGYQVDFHKGAWSEEELCEKIHNYHAIGIRSKTKLTAKVFRKAPKLLVVGCFCIGTNQVDLTAAAKAGVAVFNSPFANSRSVAELVIGEMIALSRQLVDRAAEMRTGEWNKVSKGCYEVRGKVLGIVGYGHIGSQLSVLAEAMGMSVIYHDVLPLMPLGSARQTESLNELLAHADFVTLHVPELPETKNMMGAAQLAQMKKGAYLLNNARGTVVDIPALIDSLQSGHLAGAAVDVYPREPKANAKDSFVDGLNGWESRLRACPNVILTPHIGGSTEEAQRMIGIEVANALIRYINYGGSVGSVNFPEVDLRVITEADSRVVRICYVHQNQPGSLRAINDILGSHNVDKQHTDSFKDVAYLMADISGVDDDDVRDLYDKITKTDANILTRLLS